MKQIRLSKKDLELLIDACKTWMDMEYGVGSQEDYFAVERIKNRLEKMYQTLPKRRVK